MQNSDRSQIAKEDLREMEKIFSTHHEFGDNIESIKANIGQNPERCLKLIQDIKRECRFELLPPELEESLKNALDGLEKLMRGKNKEAFKQTKRSRDALRQFISKDEDAKASE